MSFFTEGLFHNRAAPRVKDPISFRRVGKRLAALFNSLTRRKQVYALGRLNDRELADIGVTRADVQEAARWSLWGDDGGRLSELAEERRAARACASLALKRREI